MNKASRQLSTAVGTFFLWAGKNPSVAACETGDDLTVHRVGKLSYLTWGWIFFKHGPDNNY